MIEFEETNLSFEIKRMGSQWEPFNSQYIQKHRIKQTKK